MSKEKAQAFFEKKRQKPKLKAKTMTIQRKLIRQKCQKDYASILKRRKVRNNG